ISVSPSGSMEVATCSPTLRHSGLEDRGSCPGKGQLLELLGRDVAQGAVGSDGIVVQAPRLDRLERLAKTHEPVLVQTRVRIPLGLTTRSASLSASDSVRDSLTPADA